MAGGPLETDLAQRLVPNFTLHNDAVKFSCNWLHYHCVVLSSDRQEERHIQNKYYVHLIPCGRLAVKIKLPGALGSVIEQGMFSNRANTYTVAHEMMALKRQLYPSLPFR